MKLILILSILSNFGWSQTINENEIDSLKKLIGSADEELDVVLFREIGSKYKVLDFDSSLIYLRKSVNLATNIENDTLLAISNLTVGSAFMYSQKLDSATHYIKKANQVFQNLNHPKGISYTYHDLAIIYLRKGDYDKSLEYALEGLKIKEESDLSTWASYNLIGIIYYENQEWEKALFYGEESLKAAYDRKDSTISYNGIANVYRAKGNLDKAEEYILETIKYARVLGDNTGLGVFLNNYGELLYEKGKLKEAEKYFIESIEVRLKLKNYSGAAVTYGELALIYADRGLFNETDSCIKEALDLLEDDGSRPARIEILGNAFKAYSSLTRYKMALDHHLEYEALRDSVYNEEKAELITEMEAKYQTAKKEAELKQQASEITLLEKERELANTQIIIMAITIGLTLLLGLLLFRQLRVRRALSKAQLDLAQEKEEKLKSEIRYKDNELVNFALQINNKNEFIETLKNEVKEINKKSDADVKPILEIIKSSESLAKDRDEFDQYVNNVCEGFFIRLNEKYPDISASEKKLAALIRLGLSSKEIASVINISPKSVDMSRYRLRKKMSLDGESNLMEELLAV
ncbi:MAG: tetratricopeptide repeat protein [Bacteroidota bacterium]